MKLYYEILTAKPYVPALVWERLIKMCPSGQFGNIFRGKLLISDPIYSEITDLFESRHVYLGRENALKRKSSYYYSIKNLREYEPEDLDTATLLTVHHQVKVADEQERDEQGRLTIEAWRLMPEIRIGCVLSDAIIVSDDVRRQMEAEKLFGIVFKEIVPRPVERRLVLKNPDGSTIREVLPEDTDHLQKLGAFWELSSSIALPKIDVNRLLCRNNAPFDGDYSQVVGIQDEYRPAELHYGRQEMDRLGAFDLARTFEKFPYESWTVASQKFRQFCIRHRLKIGWFVVRID